MNPFDAAARRRRPSRTLAGFAAMGACGVLVLVAALAQGGAMPFALALALAVVPVPLLVVVVLALDQLEPEPTRNLVLTFLWGATVAAIVAGVVNAIGISFLSVLLGTGGGLYITLGAPVVEEVLKALVLVGVLIWRRQELDGPTDGIVYACMAGLGFAFSENITYYVAGFLSEGASGLAVTFVLRGVLSPFLHPLFTSMTGIALGYVALRRPGAARVALPLVGLALAVLLHAAWNGAAVIGGPLALILVYLLVMLPILVAVVAVTRRDRRRVARLIHQLLPLLAPEGLVTGRDLEMLADVRRRRWAVRDARRTAGRVAADAVRTYQHAATELVLAYDRLRRGTADEGWMQRRADTLLPLMQAARRTYGWSPG